MATIDIKLKTYDELIFEITTLNTNLFLKDKEIDRLNNIIKDTLDYIPNFRKTIQSHEPGLTCLKVLEDILKGGNNE